MNETVCMNIYRVHQQKDKKIMKNKSASYFFDPMLDFRRHIPVSLLKLQKWTVGINASNLCLGCVSVFSWFRFYTIITLSIYALWTKSENLENIPPPPCLKLQKYDPASPPPQNTCLYSPSEQIFCTIPYDCPVSRYTVQD